MLRPQAAMVLHSSLGGSAAQWLQADFLKSTKMRHDGVDDMTFIVRLHPVRIGGWCPTTD
jgi:hypothetical protein